MQGAYQVDNLLKHGVNNFFILLDVFLSKQPFVSYHFQVRLRHVPQIPASMHLKHPFLFI